MPDKATGSPPFDKRQMGVVIHGEDTVPVRDREGLVRTHSRWEPALRLAAVQTGRPMKVIQRPSRCSSSICSPAPWMALRVAST